MKSFPVIGKIFLSLAFIFALLSPRLIVGCKSVCRSEDFPIKTAMKIMEVIVAQDGSGKFTNVQDAIMSVPMGFATNPVVIRIKPGTYKEQIYIQREKRFFHLIGEDAEKQSSRLISTRTSSGQRANPSGRSARRRFILMRRISPRRTSRSRTPPGRWGRRWRYGFMATARCSATAASSVGRIRFWRIAGGITSRIVTSRVMWISSSAARRVIASGARFIA